MSTRVTSFVRAFSNARGNCHLTSEGPNDSVSFGPDEREDLIAKYVMGEARAHERAIVDAWRADDCALDKRIERLSRLDALVTGSDLGEIPQEPSREDAGVADLEVDAVLARRVAEEIRRIGFERCQDLDGEVRTFRHPPSGRLVMFPFEDDVVLGRLAVERLRELAAEAAEGWS